MRSPVVAAHRCNSSFIKQVMAQVQKDMEQDAKLKKDWESFQKTTTRISKHGMKGERRMRDVGQTLKQATERSSILLTEWKDWASNNLNSASSKISETTEQNEQLKKTKEFMQKGFQTSSAKTKDIFGGVMDTTSKAFSFMGDEDKKAEKLKKWKAARAAETAKEGAESSEKTDKAAKPEPEPEHALVVSTARSSTWDRFGTGLGEMPFLSSVFENPLVERVFGESEIAASIREMRETDYSFQLEEFAEEIEYVIAPHLIQSFLDGNQKALELHCGEAAFSAVNASIKTRKQQKLVLDSNILAGPEDVELKHAKRFDKGPPAFVWTFSMQQVNCLRDTEGEIVEGAVDDIRTVHYAMAVTKHPEPDTENLEYPWQISELAILYNQPCF